MRVKIFLSALFAFALAIDQATKLAVVKFLGLYDSKPLIGGVLRLFHSRNSGAAFGLKFGSSHVMLAMTLCVSLLLVYLFFSGKITPSSLSGKSAFILVLAGAFGNIIDRIRIGEVIDFIDMGFGAHRWPTYNFADIYLTIGMIVLIAYQLFQPDVQDDVNPQ